MKYVLDSNLSRFFTKLKGIFAKKSEVPSQADLDAKLSLSGGTMTGAITTSYAGILTPQAGHLIGLQSNNNWINVGNTGNNKVLRLLSASTTDLVHVKGSDNYNVLDAANTAANPTLLGAEADLTSLKLNGINYKVGGGGYAHYLTCGQAGGLLIVNSTPEAFTTTTLKSWLYNNGFVDSMNHVPINLFINAKFYNVLWCNGTSLRSFAINLSNGTSEVVDFIYDITDTVVEL